jgi:hypothetical protein
VPSFVALLYSPGSDRRILRALFRVREARQVVGALRDGEPLSRELWRECLRSAESSLRCLWAVRLIYQEQGQAPEGIGPIEEELAATMIHQARWHARLALYLLNECRRHVDLREGSLERR